MFHLPFSLSKHFTNKTHLNHTQNTTTKRRLNMSEVVSPLAFQLGVGGVGGFIVGYAIKKLSKLVLFLTGVFVLALIYLSTRGIININYDALWNAISSLFGSAGSAFSWLVGVISVLPFAGSFIAGFLIGLKLG
jgi:uncharacterized membrane protein (Fun14 family)